MGGGGGGYRYQLQLFKHAPRRDERLCLAESVFVAALGLTSLIEYNRKMTHHMIITTCRACDNVMNRMMITRITV